MSDYPQEVADKPEELQRCNVCGKEKPNTNEYFLRYFDKKYGKWRIKKLCRVCAARKAKEWREKGNPERYKEYSREFKASGRAKANKDRWIAENREHYLETRRKWRQRPEVKAKARAYDKRRQEQPEFHEKQIAWKRSWKSRNAEHVKAYQAKWAKAHKGYFTKKANERRAAMNALPCTLTESEWAESLSWFENSCAYCGVADKSLNREHVVPVKSGGGYTAANIIPACGSCNSSKGTRDMESWFREQPFFTEQKLQRIKDYLEGATE